MISVFFWFLLFGALPMLVIAFAPYWLVAIALAVHAAFWYFVSLAAAADPDPDPDEGGANPVFILNLVFAMTLAIRIISAYLH